MKIIFYSIIVLTILALQPFSTDAEVIPTQTEAEATNSNPSAVEPLPGSDWETNEKTELNTSSPQNGRIIEDKITSKTIGLILLGALILGTTVYLMKI